MIDFNDSIAAIATPPGRGGIAIVRISGPDALKVASLITTPPRSTRAWCCTLLPHTPTRARM